MCRFGLYVLKSKEFCAEVTLQDDQWAEPTTSSIKYQHFCRISLTMTIGGLQKFQPTDKTGNTEHNGIKKRYNDFCVH